MFGCPGRSWNQIKKKKKSNQTKQIIHQKTCCSSALRPKTPTHAPLEMRDELADGDLLRHLVVEVLAVEHHGLQDGQGALQHGRVHGRLVHVAGDLQRGGGRQEGAALA